MKKSELIFSAALVPIDYLMVVLAILATYALRFESVVTDLRPVFYELPISDFLPIVLVVGVVAVLVFAFAGLYLIHGSKSIVDEFGKVFLGSSATVMIIIVFLFFQREFFSSRFIILGSWLIALIFVSFGRLLMRALQRDLLARGVGRQQVVLIGQDSMTEKVFRVLTQRPENGWVVTARFPDFHEAVKDSLLKLKAEGRVDEVLQADPKLSYEENLGLVDFCQEHHLVFKYAADVFEAQSTNIEISMLAGIPIIEIKRTPLDGWGKILKRVFDLVGSSVLILLLSPVIVLAALVIPMDSRGGIFFARRDDGKKVYRIGQLGKPFWYFKLRTMKEGMDSLRYSSELQSRNLRKGSPMVKIVDDPRITRVGKWLRRYSIDELPELFLVWMGKMSLVGPRPHLPEEVAKYQTHHKKVLTIKPGITGLAQTSGRSDIDFEEEVRLDSYYIENWSLALDVKILLRTPMAVLRPRRAL